MKITCNVGTEIEILLTTNSTITGDLIESNDEEILIQKTVSGFDFYGADTIITDYHINPNMVVMWNKV